MSSMDATPEREHALAHAPAPQHSVEHPLVHAASAIPSHEMDHVGAFSKASTTNPKDLFGAVKVSTSKLPFAGIAHGAHAMMDGAVKYGPYNWRDKKVIASIYVDAAERHLRGWFEGEETASDSEVHHLGHAIACLSIILDAQENGTLIDDRPNGKGVAGRILERLSGVIKRRAAEKAK
jgi:hypothetical protein